MERLIFHIDVNSAFLSWEAARRVAAGEADIRLIPSAIGGDPKKRTGVIVAKSIPAKKLGVKTGEPVGMALRKCPELFLAKPDFRLYEKSSKAFMDICREYAPAVEKYSIDECFLDMTGTHRVYPDPVAIAHTIKDKIRNELGFTVNVGIGNCKLCAKMASDFEKPDKVHTLYPNEIREKMWPLPVGELFTVGGSTAEKLMKARIRTIGDLAQTDLNKIQKIVGIKMGQQIHAYANGIDDSPVLTEPEEAKGYSNSYTSEENIVTTQQAHKLLLALTDSVTARMRADGAKAYCVAVQIRTLDFKTRSHQRSLFNPTDISKEVYEISKALFAELWDGVSPLRLMGLALTNITKEDTPQLSLFGDEKREKASRIDKATDALNARFGSATIIRGANMHSAPEVGKKHKAQLAEKSLDESQHKTPKV